MSNENAKKIILDEYSADITLLAALTSENQLNTLIYIMGDTPSSFNFKLESWFEAVRPIDLFCCVNRMRGLSFVNEK